MFHPVGIQYTDIQNNIINYMEVTLKNLEFLQRPGVQLYTVEIGGLTTNSP